MSSHEQSAAALSSRLSCRFLPAALLIYPAHVSPPAADSPSIRFLHKLAQSADVAAVSLVSPSILTFSSESDEFSDLALWLGPGDYGRDHVLSVLAALGVANSRHKVQPNALSFHGVLPFAPPSTSDAIDPLVSQLETLRNMHSFTVKLEGEPFALNFLIGRVADESGGWGGLVGIGVWSDD